MRGMPASYPHSGGEPISDTPNRHWSWFLRPMTYGEILDHEGELRREHNAPHDFVCRPTHVWLGEARAYIPNSWWAL